MQPRVEVQHHAGAAFVAWSGQDGTVIGLLVLSIRRQPDHLEVRLPREVPGDGEPDRLAFGADSFPPQQVAKGLHVAGPEPEDVQPLQLREVVAVGGGLGLGARMALEAHVPALEAHAAPEGLDDFRAFAHPDVHQAHGAHPPRVPSGNEAPRANDDVHRRVRSVHGGEESLREAKLTFDFQIGMVASGQHAVERGRIPDVDHPEDRAVGDAQVQLALAGGEIDDVQPSVPMKQGFADVGVEVVRAVGAVVHEVSEAAGEPVLAGVVAQPGSAGEQTIEHGPGCAVIGEHPAEEVEDDHHVGFRRLVRPRAAGHRLAKKHPERLRHIERRPVRTLVPPDPALLVEGQQAAEEVHVAVLVLNAGRQVRDGVVLAVAVLVKPAVGIVEQQAFSVGVAEGFVPARDLIEGGGVLEGEAAPRQLRAAARARRCRMRRGVPRPPAPGCSHRSPAPRRA